MFSLKLLAPAPPTRPSVTVPPGDHGGDREGGGSTVNRSYYVTYNQMIKEYKIVSSTTHDTGTVSTDTTHKTDTAHRPAPSP